MDEFQRTQAQVDTSVESGHVGGIALMVGTIFLMVAGITGIFNFAALRDGDMFWPTYNGILLVIGIVCVGYGLVVRSRMSA